VNTLTGAIPSQSDDQRCETLMMAAGEQRSFEMLLLIFGKKIPDTSYDEAGHECLPKQ
jgi:hypothetical protein